MKVVYIAGPYRGPNSWEIEQNIRRAEELALMCWRLGFATICPHTNTRFYQGAAPDDLWLKGDLEIMKRCDAVMLTSNWANSQGAVIEAQVAKENNIPVFDNAIDLMVWRVNSEGV